MKYKYLIPGITSAALLLSSCGKKEKTAGTTTETTANTEAVEESTTETSTTKEALTPSQTVEGWAKDMRAGRVLSLWNSLPQQYQSDIEGIAHDFGGKVDSELYNESMKTLSAASSLLKNKKDFILELAQENSEAMGEDKVAAVKDNYDAVIGLVETIVNSDIKDTDGLKKVDLTTFFRTIEPQTKVVTDIVFTLNPEGEEAAAWMDDPKAELISEEGDTAVVKDPADPEETLKLVKVDNVWLDEETVNDWDKNMEEARQGIAAMEQMDDMQKQQILGGLRMAQAAIKDLDSAQTKEEFQQKLMALAQQFGGMFGG